MHPNELLSISDFSKLSEVSRKTLIYYDRIGLFKPAFVADNGYRYYSHSQFETIGVIHIFKELGMSLEEIQQHLGERSPETTLQLLRKQEENLQLQIAKLTRAKQMIIQRAENIEQSMHLDTSQMHVIWQAKTPLLLSRRIYSSKKEFPEELWEDFRVRLNKEHAPLGYPNGVIIPKDDLLKQDGDMISHMYCYMTTKHYKQEYMPEGFYLVSYARADYGDTEKIYPQIFDYIERKQYIIKGNAYEDYMQDEIVIQQADDYLVRVMVHIEEPKDSHPLGG
ncbi:DNA-binding transcriptional regulator, MerR family [Paenibacillus sp. UNCCL117]|uniref:MerR family transcriptional regulator n=1 Tax=unclassified Paenibacillus TaxID=185978 RepID=UPI0008808B04|nr:MULTISPECIES: MerR family transcriptional regulator [unclassified Paenibacillus]SDD32664.1 DNA-binding transcriptional regulator, MerR family [Paenibacillus sp. cl123]SFW39764.1 DNA-binding transcriptional regulator, MerR family [Paenibacillus sp. UNCCL117]